MQAKVLRLTFLLGLFGLIILGERFALAAEPSNLPPPADVPGAKGSTDGGKGMEVIAEGASRLAVLVGVNDYEECNDLAYCKADVTALRDQLVKIGFDRRDIVVLADGEKILPNRRNIVEQLDTTLKVAGAQDLVVVALSGHGARIEGRSYYCPKDARPGDPLRTMIPIDELYEKLERCPARLKMVFIDACRNNFLPVEARPLVEQGKSIDAFARSLSDVQVPKGVVLLASCTSGERSWEDRKFGHGVFMHYVLEGLAGNADHARTSGNQDGWVSLFELCDYVQLETKTYVRRTRRKVQRPYYHTSLDLPDFRLTRALRREAPIYTAWPFDAAEARRRQEETAQAIGEPVEFTNSIGMKFRLIPAGEFTMGSPDDEKDRDSDEKQHRVRITKPYYLGTCEVTVGQFEKFVKAAGYRTEAEQTNWCIAVTSDRFKRISEWARNEKATHNDNRDDWLKAAAVVTGMSVKELEAIQCAADSETKVPFLPDFVSVLCMHKGADFRRPGYEQTMDYPVTCVTWNDALAFCRWLEKKEGKKYHLPTEAQWENACRAGTATRYCCGNDPESLASFGNVEDATLASELKVSGVGSALEAAALPRDGYSFVAPVSSFRANAFGLQDMHGNVREWCYDRYDLGYDYKEYTVINPTGSADCPARVYRGGGWFSEPDKCRSANREYSSPSYRSNTTGFRVILTPVQ